MVNYSIRGAPRFVTPALCKTRGPVILSGNVSLVSSGVNGILHNIYIDVPIVGVNFVVSDFFTIPDVSLGMSAILPWTCRMNVT